jgi:hypothetical protein
MLPMDVKFKKAKFHQEQSMQQICAMCACMYISAYAHSHACACACDENASEYVLSYPHACMHSDVKTNIQIYAV